MSPLTMMAQLKHHMGHSESWQEGGVSVAHDGSGEHIIWVTVNHGRDGVSIDHDGSCEHITSMGHRTIAGDGVYMRDLHD